MKNINCIMLVDDNPADNTFHKIVINKAKVCEHIVSVSTGDEAISYLQKSIEEQPAGEFLKPDLILLDINMPAMNGFDFLKQFKDLQWKLPDTQVIMLTTSLNPDDKISSVKAFDISGFINKPLTVEKVQEIIEKHF